MPTRLLNVPLEEIRTNQAALRGVNHEDLEFRSLVDSIKKDGVLSSITLRDSSPEDTAKDGKKYILIDGLQRFTASGEAGLKEIPAQVIDKNEAEALATQIIGNAHKIETKPIEYMRAIARLLGFYPTLTLVELAGKLSQSPQWIQKIMGLSKLNPAIMPLVNESKINLSNAFMLAKLPMEEQVDWVDRAQTDPSGEFTPKVNERVKAIRDANRKGGDAGEEQFVPISTLRKKPDIEAELKEPTVGPALIRDLDIVKNAKTKDDAALKGFLLGLQWSINFDPKSIEVQRQKDNERRAKAAEDKIRREAEKKDKRAKEAQETAAKVRSEAEAARKAADALPARTEADAVPV